MRLMQPPISAGISPVSWLELRVSSSSLFSFPMVDGTFPTRALELTSIFFKETQSPTSGGMVPVRLAAEMTRVWRNGSEERLEGNGSAS